jgi:hypothetical protein
MKTVVLTLLIDTPYMAMDGGLVCQYFLNKVLGTSIIVYNPIVKTLKKLPPSPMSTTSFPFPMLHMIVDNNS